MNLTEQQSRFFKTFGYLAFPQLFSPEETAWITDGFETSIQRNKGVSDTRLKHKMFMGPIEHTEKMCTLLDDPRLAGPLADLLGEDFNYASGDGNYYNGDTPWHADGNWGEVFAVKVAFYLDPVGPETGCLRVIPGSQDPEHFVRKQKIDPYKSMEMFGVHWKDFPGNVPLVSMPGDVVMFNHDLYHASFGGSARRRMFTLNNIRHGKTDRELKLVRDYLRVHSPGGWKFTNGGGMYTPTMVDTAGPERMKHLAQATALHDEMFPQYARKGEPAAV